MLPLKALNLALLHDLATQDDLCLSIRIFGVASGPNLDDVLHLVRFGLLLDLPLSDLVFELVLTGTSRQFHPRSAGGVRNEALLNLVTLRQSPVPRACS